MKTKTARKSASRNIARNPQKLAESAMSDARCKFKFADARSCGIPRWKGHASYCLFHARQEQQLLDADRVGTELASLSGEFRTTTDLNHALGKLFAAVAQNRIPPRNAAVIAYIGQLLMQSLSGVEREIKHADGYEAWDDTIRRTLDAEENEEEEEDDDEAGDGK
ncbi:MAG: hypothetical protein WBF06_05445 [Candidatus Acidiferrales bacterium]